MDDVFILNEDDTDAARAGFLRLHNAVGRREAGRPEATLSPDELLSLFRAADPTRNAACLPWLLRTYAAGGYRLEDLSKAHDTLVAFVRVRGQLPNTATIDGEVRNPRKLGSHTTLASLWSVIAPLVEAKRLAQEEEAVEQLDTDRERALSQSRVIHRSNRMVIAVPMTKEASCWWGQGTQWCTAARNDNAFEEYYKKAPLIVICLRKSGDLPSRKLQLHVHTGDMQFMDENDARVSQKIILERWQDLETLLHWTVGGYGWGLRYMPGHLRTEAICTAAVGRNGMALEHVPEHLRTEALCLAAVGNNGYALRYVPEPLRTEAICTAAVGRHGEALHHVPKHLRTEAACLSAVSSNGSMLKYVPEYLRTEAVCLAAVGSNGMALDYVPKPLRTEAICLAAVGSNGRALFHVPKPLRTETICTVAVGRNGWSLEYVPEPLRTEEMCLAAVCRNGLALESVPEHLRTEAMCQAAITQDVTALQFVPEILCAEAMCLFAVGSDGWALRYVPEPLRTEEMCLAAVGSNGWALRYIPEPLRMEAICTTAVGSNGMALEFVPEPLRTKAVCLAAVSNNRLAISHVPRYLRVEITQLSTEVQDKQKSSSVTDETNERESYDLVLSGLEDCLDKLQLSCQNMLLPSS